MLTVPRGLVRDLRSSTRADVIRISVVTLVRRLLIRRVIYCKLLNTKVIGRRTHDEPGQKDLSKMSSDPGAAAIAITWNWDDTDFGNLGGNTGDGCALIDTDADGNANRSFCVVVDGNPAVRISNRLYTCNDTRSDRCNGPTLVTTALTSTSSASVVPLSDPFGSHPLHTDGNDCANDANCLRMDTVANVSLQLSDVGGTAAKTD
jgi:hypothetical protein